MLNKDTKVICTPFADDFNLITTHKKTHQNIMDEIHSNTTSMGLKLKPSKCRTFSIVSGKPTPVIFSMDKSPLETIEKDPHKFLGHNITFNGKQSETFTYIEQYFSERLERIDQILVRGEYKIEIYKKYLLPASRFLLTVHEISKTNLTKLDSLSHRYLKSWAGLPQCAATEIFHLPIFLDIPTVTQIYLQSHSTAHASSRIKADETVQAALDSKLEREAKWIRKFSIAQYSDSQFKDIPQDPTTDQTITLAHAKKTIKTSVKDEMLGKWTSHISSLVQQGAMIKLIDLEEMDTLWKSYIFNLPRGALKFLLNAVLDTLPTGNNLHKWGKRSGSACDLCKAHNETLMHTLNNCPVSLEQGRYTWRHNSVLQEMYTTLSEIGNDEWTINADLPDHNMSGPSTVPCSILPTSLKPDIVLLKKNSDVIILVELTVCFESGILKAEDRKSDRYASLLHDLSDVKLDPKLITIEIGSRGLIDSNNTNKLHSLFKAINPKLKYHNKAIRSFRSKLSRISVLCSYALFYAKFNQVWKDSPLLRDR